MNYSFSLSPIPFASASRVLPVLLTLLLALATPGCQSNSHTFNPRLRKIDEMLAAQLPKGTPRSRVELFLHSRGFPEQYSTDRKDVIAIVRQVDTETLQPATARVTFHFDPLDKLTTYDMEAAPDNAGQ
jgi:hypothetical protein